MTRERSGRGTESPEGRSDTSDAGREHAGAPARDERGRS